MGNDGKISTNLVKIVVATIIYTGVLLGIYYSDKAEATEERSALKMENVELRAQVKANKENDDKILNTLDDVKTSVSTLCELVAILTGSPVPTRK